MKESLELSQSFHGSLVLPTTSVIPTNLQSRGCSLTEAIFYANIAPTTTEQMQICAVFQDNRGRSAGQAELLSAVPVNTDQEEHSPEKVTACIRAVQSSCRKGCPAHSTRRQRDFSFKKTPYFSSVRTLSCETSASLTLIRL